jgi:hypothetical protein
MKQLLTLIVVLFAVVTVNATERAYKKVDLKQMNKTTLTEIYLNQVTQLCMNLPYTPFTLFGKDSSNFETTSINVKMDIPQSDYFQNKRTVTDSQSVAYGDVIKKEFYEIIPYSDKSDIISSILYLQKVNQSIKSQKKISRLSLNRLVY